LRLCSSSGDVAQPPRARRDAIIAQTVSFPMSMTCLVCYSYRKVTILALLPWIVGKARFLSGHYRRSG
jgi:hypothetical protein